MGYYYTLAPYIVKRPWLYKLVQPVAAWYQNLAGYRQMGLMCDDLINEEDEVVLKALKRLPEKVAYDRVYRLRRATQLSLSQKILPKEEWIKPEEDVPYLMPLIDQVYAEIQEEKALNNLEIIKKSKH
ncbi:ubiquinol-cytochrome C reductase-like protein [Apodospora peruviana]|uniref:Cytochrome b-c1 complex subunit 7 n=1 Tax=Apodospora peruviana TaxID=516989 RepID=A0AAE0IIN4_9PEZI|nr:ubiquinol-cytochrome C reductase-like protein [Apodospora peruviana]